MNRGTAETDRALNQNEMQGRLFGGAEFIWQPKYFSGWLGGLSILLLPWFAACRTPPHATPTGTSTFRYYAPPAAAPSGAKSTVTAALERFDYRDAQAIEPLVMPVFPQHALAAKAGTVTVGVHVTIDRDGHVSDIRPSIWIFSTPAPFKEEFRVAVEAAVRQWRFVPAEERRMESFQENGLAGERVTQSEPMEAEFDLAFDFTAGQVRPTGRAQ